MKYKPGKELNHKEFKERKQGIMNMESRVLEILSLGEMFTKDLGSSLIIKSLSHHYNKIHNPN